MPISDDFKIISGLHSQGEECNGSRVKHALWSSDMMLIHRTPLMITIWWHVIRILSIRCTPPRRRRQWGRRFGSWPTWTSLSMAGSDQGGVVNSHFHSLTIIIIVIIFIVSLTKYHHHHHSISCCG